MSISSVRRAAARWRPFAAGFGRDHLADGLVPTNAYVVDGADVIQVQLSDKRTIRADSVVLLSD